VRHSIVVDVVPPAQTHQQPSRDVLDRPEVGGQEEHHKHKAGDEGVAEPAAEHVDHDGGAPEEQVEEGDVGVPVGWKEEGWFQLATWIGIPGWF